MEHVRLHFNGFAKKIFSPLFFFLSSLTDDGYAYNLYIGLWNNILERFSIAFKRYVIN